MVGQVMKHSLHFYLPFEQMNINLAEMFKL